MESASVVPPVPAATLVLARDATRGLEVLMTRRHEAAGFAGGALVFPGGKVDPADEMLAQSHCCGMPHAPRDAAARLAAIRETWEECGVLLARRKGERAHLAEAELMGLREARGRRIADLLDEAGLQPATDLLVPFAHWITPVDRPKRFDTRFYLAAFDGDQVPAHDGYEAVETRWVDPAEAIAEADAGRLKVVFATRMNLIRLSRWRRVADALAAAREQSIVTVTPQVVKTPAGLVFRIPAEAGYGVCEVPAEGIARA